MLARSLCALVVLLGLGLGHQARAGGGVDWSDYLEPPGAKTPVRATPSQTQRPAKAVTAPKKATRTVAKKSGGSRNKAKAGVRTKRRR